MSTFKQIKQKLTEMGAGGMGGGAPANSAGSGAIAGIGVGLQGEPGVSPKDQPRAAKIVLGRLRRKNPQMEDRDYKAEYENYHSKPEQKKNRAKRNNARRFMEREGRAQKGDGKDVDHRDSNPQNNSPGNLRILKASTNRSMNEEKINEVFGSVINHKWIVKGPRVNQAEFEVSKNDKVRVTFKKLDASKNDWEVDFARANMDTKNDFTTARITTGFSYEILSTVLETIKEFVKEIHPDSLWITGIEKGKTSDSRTKLYDTMTKILPHKIDYKLTHREDLGGSVIWVLQPKNKLNEDYFGGNKIFKVKSEYYHRCRLGKKKYHRYDKYVGNDEFGEEIRKYGRKHYDKPIIVQDEKTGAMMYLRYGKK